MSATRRDALEVLAVGGAFPPGVRAAGAPASFTPDEFAVLSRLADLILPRTDTPGAADAGVPASIDQAAAHDEALRATLREGIASLGGLRFLALSEADQVAALRRIGGEGGAPEAPFFRALKGQVIDAYYSTKEGLVTQLGYQGNVPLAEFPGCTHPEHQRLD